MARIKTYYDYEIKKEAFEVLGDVGYTKSTDITLTPIAFSNSMIEYGVQTFTVDVVGEKGTSEIIIYDNDLPIPVTIDGTESDMITWSEEDTILTFTTKLNYDVEHNIRARFKGNDKCLGSKSRLITINEPMPDLYTATLQRYNDTTVDYTPNTAFTLPIEFISGQQLVNAETKTVEWFIDDVSQGTTNITIPANGDRGNTTLEVEGLSEGLHTIRVEFDGDTHSSQTSFSFQISVGYYLELVSYPTFIINNQSLTFTTKATNYLGTPLANVSLDATLQASSPPHQKTIIKYCETNENGECTITCESSEWDNITSSSFPITAIITKSYSSSNTLSFNTAVIRNVTVNLSADTNIVSTGSSATLTATINGTRNPIPVTFNGAITGTYTTSEDGLVVKQYNGSGAGDVSVTASIYDSSSSLTIEDVLQYWRANNISYNQSYSVPSGTFQELNNGYKLTAGSMVNVNMDLSEDFEITFSIVQGNSVYDVTSSTGQGTKTDRKTYNNIPIALLTSVAADTVATGDTIKFTHVNGEYILYKNNEVVWSSSMTAPVDFLPISVSTPQSTPTKKFISGYIIFNNLKVKRL